MMGDNSFFGRADVKPVPNVPAGKQKAAEYLASKYTRSKRALEVFSCISFVLLIASCIYRLAKASAHYDWVEACIILLISIITSMAAGDFVSGLVHWTADTWGDLSVPIFSTFIRSFREHHIDPVAMTRHDFIETNGDSCLACLPTLILMVRYFPLPGDMELGWLLGRLCYSFFCFITVLAVVVSFTNEFHKWAHTYRPPAWIKALQDMHIVLPAHEHQIHHKPPHDQYYCITNGWLNEPLHRIGFWRKAERIVSSWTGAIPRRDDFSWMKTASAYASVSSTPTPSAPVDKVE